MSKTAIFFLLCMLCRPLYIAPIKTTLYKIDFILQEVTEIQATTKFLVHFLHDKFGERPPVKTIWNTLQ